MGGLFGDDYWSGWATSRKHEPFGLKRLSL
jgi:hypothetical protein